MEHRTDIACDSCLPISLSKVEEESDGLFAILGRDSDLILGQIVSMSEKTLGNTNLIASCDTERKILTRPEMSTLLRFLLYCWHGNAECLFVAPNLKFHPETVVKRLEVHIIPSFYFTFIMFMYVGINGQSTASSFGHLS